MSAPQRSERRDAVVLALAVGVVGATFGVLAEEAGLSMAKALALSVFTFTGASQFAAVSIVNGGGSPASAVASALLLAARNALYGPVVGPVLRGGRLRRLLSAQFVIDETTAMASARPDADRARAAFWYTAIWLFVLWVIGTVVGVVVGNAMGDPDEWGLDAAFPAAFIALLVPHLRRRAGRVAAALGGLIALAAVPIAPAGLPILLAALAVVPALRVEDRRP